MKSKNCLYCYNPLTKGEKDFHEKCSLKFFGIAEPPLLDLDKNQLEQLAEQIILKSVAITGVQPKLSLTIERPTGDNKRSRLTIVGLWGNYILKPQSGIHKQLPENEDLTMHLSELFKMNTAEHSLLRTTSDEIVYIVKRFDRIKEGKLQCEDFCQLSELLTENKYRSSMERTGKLIKLHTANPLLEAIAFFELTIFCFLSGNADMHLKNFSLLKDTKGRNNLAPFYDLLNTKLAIPKDTEEMALTLNGRKSRINRTDFNKFGTSLGMSEKQLSSTYQKFSGKISDAIEFIARSFLSEDLKKEYTSLFLERAKRLQLG